MPGNTYGLDLGSYEIKIYEKKTGAIRQEKNVVAVRGKSEIFAVGSEAYEMFEKEPAGVRIVFPMKNGVIARFDNMQVMLGSMLGKDRRPPRGAKYVIAVPTDVTEVEKKAFFDLLYHSDAKARSVRIVERPLADALGLGLDIFNERGIFIVNLGGSTTELSVLSEGGMVMNRLIPVGGENMDAAIAALLRRNKDFLIGRSTAERVRHEFGLFDAETRKKMNVFGRDLITGVPSGTEITIGMVRSAVKEPLKECVEAILTMLSRTPPDIRRKIEGRGLYLTGGLTNLKGIPGYLEESTGLKVHTVSRPELCVVNGLKHIISEKEIYRRLTYSMLDKNYRWLR